MTVSAFLRRHILQVSEIPPNESAADAVPLQPDGYLDAYVDVVSHHPDLSHDYTLHQNLAAEPSEHSSEKLHTLLGDWRVFAVIGNQLEQSMARIGNRRKTLMLQTNSLWPCAVSVV